MSFISIKNTNGNLVSFLFSSKGTTGTPQHFDSHPCTRPPSWGRQRTQQKRRSSELGGIPYVWGGFAAPPDWPRVTRGGGIPWLPKVFRKFQALHLIFTTYNPQLLIHQILMTHSCPWPKAPDACPNKQNWLGLPSLNSWHRISFFSAMSHEPWAESHEPFAVSLAPLNITW